MVKRISSHVPIVSANVSSEVAAVVVHAAACPHLIISHGPGRASGPDPRFDEVINWPSVHRGADNFASPLTPLAIS